MITEPPPKNNNIMIQCRVCGELSNDTVPCSGCGKRICFWCDDSMGAEEDNPMCEDCIELESVEEHIENNGDPDLEDMKFI